MAAITAAVWLGFSEQKISKLCLSGLCVYYVYFLGGYFFDHIKQDASNNIKSQHIYMKASLVVLLIISTLKSAETFLTVQLYSPKSSCSRRVIVSKLLTISRPAPENLISRTESSVLPPHSDNLLSLMQVDNL